MFPVISRLPNRAKKSPTPHPPLPQPMLNAGLVEYIISGPVVAIVLEGKDVVVQVGGVLPWCGVGWGAVRCQFTCGMGVRGCVAKWESQQQQWEVVCGCTSEGVHG